MNGLKNMNKSGGLISNFSIGYEKSKGRNNSNNTQSQKLTTLEKFTNYNKTLIKPNKYDDKSFFANPEMKEKVLKMKGNKKENNEKNFTQLDSKKINIFSKTKTNLSDALNEDFFLKIKKLNKRNISLDFNSQNNSVYNHKSNNVSILGNNDFILNNKIALNPNHNNKKNTLTNPNFTLKTEISNDNTKVRNDDRLSQLFNEEQTHKTEPNEMISKIIELENQLDCFQEFISKKQETDVISKKTNMLKLIFDEIIKISPQEAKSLLTKVNNGYNEIIGKILNQNTNNELEELKLKYKELNNLYQEKENENKQLSEKIKDASQNSENRSSKNNQFSQSTNQPANTQTSKNDNKRNSIDTEIKIELEKEKNDTIHDLNKLNINDLEAIYFLDKVHMRSNSVSDNIPKLNFNIFNTESDLPKSKVLQNNFCGIEKKNKVIKSFLKESNESLLNELIKKGKSNNMIINIDLEKGKNIAYLKKN